MNKLFKVFFLGWGISLFGTIPLGTLNIAAAQISVAEGVTTAVSFVAGAALVEVVYAFITLLFFERISRRKNLLKIIAHLSAYLLLLLCVFAFYAAFKNSYRSTSFIAWQTNSYFVLGLLMSGINPAQVPFWLGWSAVLKSKGLLEMERKFYYWLISGIGMGTVFGLMLFVMGGHFAVDWANRNKAIINFVIGFVFLIMASMQFYKIFSGKTHEISSPSLLLRIKSPFKKRK